MNIDLKEIAKAKDLALKILDFIETQTDSPKIGLDASAIALVTLLTHLANEDQFTPEQAVEWFENLSKVMADNVRELMERARAGRMSPN